MTVHGVPDPAFGPGGSVYLTCSTGPVPGAIAIGEALAIERDQKIVVAGFVLEDEWSPRLVASWRLLPTGLPDTSFGDQGVRIFQVGDSAIAYAVAVQPDDGAVLIAGRAYQGGWPLYLARLTSDGAVDTGFGTGGVVFSRFDDYAEGRSIQIQRLDPNAGRILVAGHYRYPGTSGGAIVVARFGRDGSPDTSFGSGGRAMATLGETSAAYASVILPDDSIVVAGDATVFGTPVMVVAKFGPNGELDASFGSHGFGIADFGSGGWARAIALDHQGRLVVAGYAGGSTQRFAWARFTAAGWLDPSFGSSGRQVHVLQRWVSPTFSSQATGVVVETDGSILTVGFAESGLPGLHHTALVQLREDGTLDPQFNGRPMPGIPPTVVGDGETCLNLSAALGGLYDVAAGVVLQRDRKPVTVGTADGSAMAVVVERYV